MPYEQNYYEILAVEETSSFQEIRQAYYKLARLYHPDKQANHSNTPENQDQFVKIQAAFEILSDKEKRHDYDNHRRSQDQNSHHFVQEIDLDDMEYIPGQTNADTYYTSPCRCGENYQVSIEELEDGTELVQCAGCSLTIRLLYEEADPEDHDETST